MRRIAPFKARRDPTCSCSWSIRSSARRRPASSALPPSSPAVRRHAASARATRAASGAPATAAAPGSPSQSPSPSVIGPAPCGPPAPNTSRRSVSARCATEAQRALSDSRARPWRSSAPAAAHDAEWRPAQARWVGSGSAQTCVANELQGSPRSPGLKGGRQPYRRCSREKAGPRRLPSFASLDGGFRVQHCEPALRGSPLAVSCSPSTPPLSSATSSRTPSSALDIMLNPKAGRRAYQPVKWAWQLFP
jgi:hypothetical protein